VIKTVTASSLDNTGLVELEDSLAGHDSNRDGVNNNSNGWETLALTHLRPWQSGLPPVTKENRPRRLSRARAHRP
jgi:hypothetical protein